jgi:adenosine deaminase
VLLENPSCASHEPVALSTDDPGIERIDLTHEYVRAVETYGLSYADLKEMVRNSLEYSFRRAQACGTTKAATHASSPIA